MSNKKMNTVKMYIHWGTLLQLEVCLNLLQLEFCILKWNFVLFAMGSAAITPFKEF